MSFDPCMPYGPVVETTMRVVTWNIWGRYGRWEERQVALEAELAHAHADLVCLVESWSTEETTQAERIAAKLGMEHSLFVGDWQQDAWTSGVGIASRWPLGRHESRGRCPEAPTGVPAAPCSSRSTGPAGSCSSSS